MNTAQPQRTWDKVESITSLCLLVVLVSVIGCRLIFAPWWPMPVLDLVASSIAVALITASLWVARHRRSWRLWVVAYASATQLVPMVCRTPALILPLVGALVPVAVLLVCLAALSKKKPAH
ncbi:MAG TPA: LrgA [Frateuria sp.]|uniref:LrgA n=1 Tax=Frateuria sp. TaxID=2211372 RepID=UPI002DE99174|nr:LrgA [Frateuria sp.]